MLASQGLRDPERAARHRELYLRFKADEASQFVTGDYRRTHPDDNNERLPIHEHRKRARAFRSPAVSQWVPRGLRGGRRNSSAFCPSWRSPRNRAPGVVDVTEAAGIDFVHENGAFGEKYLPETMGRPGWPSSTPTATATRTCSSSTAGAGRGTGRNRSPPRRSTGTGATGPSRTRPPVRASTSRSTAWAWRSPTTTPTGTRTSTSPSSGRTACSRTPAAGCSGRRRTPPRWRTPAFRASPPGSTPTVTGTWISSC